MFPVFPGTIYMSIAILKKKTASLYNNQSVGQKQFSLNGGYRSQGWVGQSVISRSLPRTLARGNAIRGYGGINGSYNTMNGHTITSGLVNFNNNKVIKPSVINNSEMLEIRNKCLRSFNMIGKGLNIVKSSGGNQIDRITRISKCALAKFDANKTNAVSSKKCATLDSKYINPSYKRSTNIETCHVTKDIHKKILSEGVYIDNISSLCVKVLDNTRVGYNRGPLPGY